MQSILELTTRRFSPASIFKLYLTLLLLLPGLLVQAQADLILSPVNSSVSVGDNLTLTLQVVAGSQEIDGIETYLDFDPALITVNSVTYNASNELPTTIIDPKFDPAGTIDAASGILGGGSVSGTFDYITIDLTATTAGTTTIAFSYDTGPPNRKTEISRIGNPVLGNTTDASITIVNSNTSPTVSITSPTDGTVFNDGDDVAITATANDTDGSVSSVAFFDGTTALGVDNTSPYSITLSNISVGNHDLTAVATDNDNATTTSAVVTISAQALATQPEITVGGPASKVVAEGESLQIPISVSDLDGDNLTVTITSVSEEPQLLQTGNSGAQADPYPTTADSFLSVSSEVNNPGGYSANLDFTPTFGDGGGANGDGDGVYTVTVTVSDGENTATAPFTVTVTDTPQPLSVFTSTRIEAESFDNQGPPHTGSGSNGIGVEVNGTGITNIGYTHVGEFVEYLIDVPQAGTYDFSFQVAKASGSSVTMDVKTSASGPVLGSIVVDPTGGWQNYVTATTSADLPAGLQTLRFEWSAGSGFLFNIDYFDVDFAGDVAPQVTITAPSDGDNFIEGSTVTVSVDASDDIGITEVELFDGNTSLGTDATAPYEFTITSATGTYVLTATASDGTTTSTSASVTISSVPSNTAPVLVINAPVNGATVPRGTDITLTGTVTDAEENDLAADIQWSSSDIQFSTDPTNGIGASITAQLVTPGSQTITANVTDGGGLSDSDQITVTVANPEVTITAPAAGATLSSTNVQLQWDAENMVYDLAEHFHIFVNPPDINNIDTDTRISTASAVGQTFWNLTEADGIVEGSNTIVLRPANQFHEEFLSDPNDPSSYIQDAVSFNVEPAELPDACENTLYRVNVGGLALPSADDTPLGWSADQGNFGTAGNSPFLVAMSTGGSTYNGNSGSAHSGPIDMSDPTVPSSAPAAVFNTERYDAGSAPEMKWEFPVTPGSEVQVTLLFAELFGGVAEAGKRVFDVAIEGTVLPAFDDIDPYAIAGPKGAFTRSATLTVNDDVLSIEFIHNIENPALKGIQICGLSEPVDNTPPVITLLGDNSLNLTVGDAYADPGFTATDDVDGDLTASVVVGGDVVNTSIAGTYVVTYNVMDAANNPAVEVTRTVNVSEPDVACAYVAIAPSSNNLLTASTFSNGLIVTNNSQGNLQITSVSFDLSTAIYPNMVFDPVGTAGDATAKCLTVTSQTGGDGDVGLTIPGNGGSGSDPDCTAPFAGEAEVGNGGYYVMNVVFDDFEPGESVNFAIDIDPTSIEGFNSAGNAGAISGLELAGATVIVEFSDGQSVTTTTGELYRIQPNSNSGSENYFYSGSNSTAPGLTVTGATGTTSVPGFVDATVGGEAQTVQISGTPGDAVSLLILESTIEDLGPGITPGAFEANKAQTVQEIDAIIGNGGTVDIPVELADNASGDIYHLVAVRNRTGGGSCTAGTSNLSDVWRLKVDPVFGEPSVLIEVTPGAGLGASTYGGSDKFQIINQSTGNLQVTGVSFDLSTGILPDMVFDPTGSGGDATAQCFNPGSTAAAVGLVTPADPCIGPFSNARNGGFDVLSTTYTDFDPGESFSFSTDIDPNSIQGVAGAGNAGAVSGYELIGATLTVTFSDGSTLTSSLYEEGSLGGSQTLVINSAPVAPVISVAGLASTPATVSDLDQTIRVVGTPGDHVSLLVMDSRLFIASGDPPFGVPDETYYANEAMSGKTLYTGTIGGSGTVDIPVTLLVTPGANSTPDGGLNQLVAVTSSSPYTVDQAVSATSNVITLRYNPAAGLADLAVSVTRQGMAEHSGEYTVKLYPVGDPTPAYDLTAVANAAGEMVVSGIALGTYEVAVKFPNSLQVVDVVTVSGTNDAYNAGELKTGDVNDNNHVNILDFSTMVNSFNLEAGDGGYNANANLNGMGKVNILDFSLMVSNFNEFGEVPSGFNP